MTTTQITTIAGCVSAVCLALQGIPDLSVIPYSRLALVVISCVAGAVFAYFAKGRGDSGAV